MPLSIDKYLNKREQNLEGESLDVYMGYLSTRYSIIETRIEGAVGSSLKGDFNGIMRHLGVPPSLWRLTTYINSLGCSLEYSGFLDIKVFDDDAVIAMVNRLKN